MSRVWRQEMRESAGGEEKKMNQGGGSKLNHLNREHFHDWT